MLIITTHFCHQLYNTAVLSLSDVYNHFLKEETFGRESGVSQLCWGTLKYLFDAIRSIFERCNILTLNFISVVFFNRSLVWFSDRPTIQMTLDYAEEKTETCTSNWFTSYGRWKVLSDMANISRTGIEHIFMLKTFWRYDQVTEFLCDAVRVV